MKIKKTFQGELPENKILNTESSSQTDTYSCDYINGMIEVTTNFNGTAIKFPDGTMICKQRKLFGDVGIGLESNAIPYVCTPLSFDDFPVEFIDVPAVNITAEGGVSCIVINTTESTTKKPYSFSLGRYNSLDTRDFYINYIAIGRWK